MRTSTAQYDPSLLIGNPQHALNKFEQARSTLGTRTGPNVRWLQEAEDDSKLVLPKKDLTNGIPTLARATMDFESGIACYLGQPNHGKSTLIVNQIAGGLELNDDLLCVDLSLDDALKKRYVQYLACLTGLHYSTINVPQSASEAERMRLQQADAKIKGWVESGRLLPLEASERIRTTFEEQEKMHRIDTRHYKTQLNLMTRLRDKYPDKKIAFFIDAWNNLDYTNSPGEGDLNQVKIGRAHV